jgi:hypothetical protein
MCAEPNANRIITLVNLGELEVIGEIETILALSLSLILLWIYLHLLGMNNPKLTVSCDRVKTNRLIIGSF